MNTYYLCKQYNNILSMNNKPVGECENGKAPTCLSMEMWYKNVYNIGVKVLITRQEVKGIKNWHFKSSSTLYIYTNI